MVVSAVTAATGCEDLNLNKVDMIYVWHYNRVHSSISENTTKFKTVSGPPLPI